MSDGWRQRYHRVSTRLYGPSPDTGWLSWIADQRVAIGNLPTATTLPKLTASGITHVVNCRSTAQVWLSQDLAVERALFGASRVIHAPMWDRRRPQPPRLWSAAACFAAQVLTEDPTAGILIHCQQGRCRSVMLTYAVLRLRGLPAPATTALITRYRVEAQIVAAYITSVETWLAAGATPTGRIRLR
jgi:protein-tyrosine phosphatase